MSIFHAEDFRIYGSQATRSLMLDGVYAELQGSLANDPDGVSSGQCLYSQQTNPDNSSVLLRYVFPQGAVNTVGVCLRQWMTNLPANNGAQIKIMICDAANTELFSMWITSTGQVVLETYASGTNTRTQYTTTVPVLTANAWWHMEWKYAKTGATTADFELRVEGQTKLTQVAAVVDNRVPAQIRWQQGNVSKTYNAYWKHFVLWDGTGANNNNFLGSVLTTNLAPDGDASLNWGLNGGASGYSILSAIPPDNSKFIYAEDSPIPDAYVGTMSALPADVTSVRALVTFVRAAKTDGGDGSLQVGLISDPLGVPATVLGANRAITIAQTYWRDVFETDPKTGALWTPGAVDVARIQINRTA
jgi:hypothetical protein